MLVLLASAMVARAASPSDSALYEAYNQLHTLSQRVLGAEIESPAVVVVGRQTDGKSALIEALMGFQFNHVGGGTKTRKPIALQMQYDPAFEEPACYLAIENGEQRVSLRELQAYIEKENARLEAAKAFEGEEIIVRIRYKYCPNLSIIDTPGLLPLGRQREETYEAATADEREHEEKGTSVQGAAHSTDSERRSFGSPRLQLHSNRKTAAYAGIDSARASTPRKMAVSEPAAVAAPRRLRPRPLDAQEAQATMVEELVLSKIRSNAAIILCVEECNNWQLAPARSVVSRADPGLRRTVLVSSKLDTKFAQFGRPAELAQFLGAAQLHRRHPQLLGGPFFTSVPATRIGMGKHAFASNEEFQSALGGQEMGDRQYVQAVLPPETAPLPALERLGVSKLRNFLEQVLRDRYLLNLNSIIPQLQQASSRIGSALDKCDASFRDFTPDRVQQLCTRVVHRFAARIIEAVQGSAAPEARELGMTLEEEVEQSGTSYLLHVARNEAAPASSEENGTPQAEGVVKPPPRTAGDGASSALFGGAQYHRLVREFASAVGSLPAVPIPPEEVTNSMGVAAGSDALHVGRSTCVIALQHSAEQMRPLLFTFFARLRFIIERLSLFARGECFAELGDGRVGAMAGVDSSLMPGAPMRSGDAQSPELEALVGPRLCKALVEAFALQVENSARAALDVCLTDLQVIASSAAGAAPDVAAIYPLLYPEGAGADDDSSGGGRGAHDGRRGQRDEEGNWAPLGWYEADPQVDRIASRVVGVWRAQFAQAVQRKVHSLFLLTLMDDLPSQLMRILNADHEESFGALDLGRARDEIEQRRERLAREHVQARDLLQSFHRIKALYVSGKGLPPISKAVVSGSA